MTQQQLKPWESEALKLRGTLSDSAIAEKIGKHKSTVSRFFTKIDQGPDIQTSSNELVLNGNSSSDTPSPTTHFATPPPEEPKIAPSRRMEEIKARFDTQAPLHKKNASTGIFKNDSVIVVVTLLLMVSVACVITAPLIQDALPKQPAAWSYILGVVIDLLPLLFVLRGRHTLGKFFALSTGLQFAIAFHVFDPISWIICMKGIIISITVMLAIYGLSDTIENA